MANIRLIALLAAIVPFIAVHLSYLTAASYGHVDWCFPYIDSCTSISATGRKPPASYIFRGLMLPSAVFMMAYWWVNFAWMQSLAKRSTTGTFTVAHTMLILGVFACVGLILYVTVLGEPGRQWAQQRRIGTILFFSFTFLAQLLLVLQLRRLSDYIPNVPQRLPNAMLRICQLLLVLGVLTVVLDVWDEDWYETVEDAFEWVLTLLLQSNFLLGYFVWRHAKWRLEFTNEQNPPR